MSFESMTSDEHWAVKEFAQVELKDARLNRRCQDLAVSLSQQPTAPINQACEEWPEGVTIDRRKVTEKRKLGTISPY